MFVKIEIWNFQHLFDLLFRETSQKFSSFEQLLFPIEKSCLNVCLNELKFCKVSRNPKSNRCWKFQLSILTNKKVLFLKKIWSVPCTMDSSFFSQQMPYCLATLLVYMALIECNQSWHQFWQEFWYRPSEIDFKNNSPQMTMNWKKSSVNDFLTNHKSCQSIAVRGVKLNR